MKIFPQLDEMDCGPSCLAMITNHYGKQYDIADLRNRCWQSFPKYDTQIHPKLM